MNTNMICRAIPHEGKEPYIFVSYCHADKEQVYPLIEQLSLDGYRTWYDVGNKPGINWLLNIEDHLENCRAVIAFISRRSSDSDNCNKEIIYAMKCGKKVIPVLIEDVALPRGLRMQLVDLHYLERKHFPTDRELLRKCCEAEECKECKSPSGSIPLRNVESVRHREESQKGSLDGWKQVERKKPVQNPEAEKDPMPEQKLMPDPIPDHQSKPEHETGNRAPVETAAEEENGETTYVPPTETDDDKTIYGPGLGIGIATNGLDDDKTIMISRNLAILLHPAEQKAYKLKSPKITIGRSRIRCDVAIDGNDSISKVHAIIRQTRQKCYIEDANSSNGTYINGEQIKSGEQIPLENPAVFQLNDETLILLSGTMARKFDKKPSVSLLLNEEGTAVRILDSDTLALNRNNKWPDGTLSDPKVHRAGHALLTQRKDGVHLVDVSPDKGNGTYLNGSRLYHGTERCLSSGDRIRLGDTTLEFISIEIPS